MDWLKKSTRTKVLDTNEKRKTYRIGCSVPMVIQVDNSSAIEGRVLNLSTTGLKIQVPQAPKVGATYTMWIRGKTLPGGVPPRELGVQGRCVWVQRYPQKATCEAGLLYTDFFGNPLAQVLQFFDRELGVALGDGQQKRTWVRAAKRLKITYDVSSEGRVANAFTRNLSENGVAFFTRSKIEAETELNVTVYLDNGEKLRASGKVVWYRKVPGEDLYEIGTRFDTVAEAERARLTAFIGACMADNATEG